MVWSQIDNLLNIFHENHNINKDVHYHENIEDEENIVDKLNDKISFDEEHVIVQMFH